ncbi:MAG: hypothetical protein FJW38_27030 [Acidobacteria bacterium]|nr:hypothetical protein [Acidobacteriota bacterium]
MSHRILLLLTALFGSSAFGQQIGNCPVFPANNIWNTRVDQLAVHPSSASWVTTIGSTAVLHPDFGAGMWNGGPIGIPFVTVTGSQTKYPATFLYQSESDPGPYAVPLNAPIEGGSASTGDRHAIAIDTDNCLLYELYRAFPQTSSWKGDSGAIFNLNSHALRPLTWTSADAAGLPIFAGLVRYDEILAGEIKHAIRFTVPQSQRAFLWPGRHYASSLTGAQYPPMGARFRLKANFDISGFSPANQIILTALKRYGMMLADNGSAWFISGAPDPRWNDTDLRALQGSNFEAVDTAPLMIDVNSGEARQTSVSVSVSPASASVEVNTQRQFTATVTGTSNQAVTWDVNGVVGGNSVVGFIDSITGLYTAPQAAVTVSVRAKSDVEASAIGTSAVTVVNPPPLVAITISPTSTNVRAGRTRQFTATVTNTTNTSVTWKVNGITGGNSSVGTISTSGLYRAPSAAGTATVSATSNADPAKTANAAVTITKR